MPDEKVLTQINKDFPSEEELRDKDDVFGSGETNTVEKQDDVITEDLKNRHIRRLEAKLTREREANIELNAREAARSEYEKFHKEVGGLTIDERVASIFTNDEVGKRSAEVFQSLLDDVKKQSKEEALSELLTKQQEASQETERYGNLIEEQLEQLEEDYNVDLSGTTDQSKQLRNSFLGLVERLSPKDASGNIESYADFENTWEIFQERQKKSNDRQKDLGSRGMVRSSVGKETDTGKDAAEKYLRQQGII